MSCRLCLAVPLLAALTACTAEVEVQTTPQDLAIPVTSVGVDAFAELAIPMPEEARGVITVQSVRGTATAINPASGTTLRFQLFVLPAGVQGTATPDAPFLFTEANPPSYFNQLLPLASVRSFPPSSEEALVIENAGLVPAVAQPTLWLVASNTVESLAIGEVLPLELRLDGLSFNVVVTKSFESSGNAVDLVGL